MTEIEELIEVEEETGHSNALILFNDEINSFQHVAFSLIQILGYDLMRSEQLTLLAHTKGKVSIKEGDFLELEKYHYSFGELNITTEIN